MRFPTVPLITACALLLPTIASAQCVMFDTPTLFERSIVVFRGTVMSTRATGAGGAHQIRSIATFAAGQGWKGDAGRGVVSPVSVGVDRALPKDVEYLVFAAGNPLTTSVMCGWTVPVAEAGKTIAWLNQRRLEDLAAAEARWSANKPAAYEFAIEVRCFCGADGKPRRFRVADGRAVPLQELHQGEQRVYGAYDTVEKVFALVRSSIEQQADNIDVRYDTALGYPAVVGLDRIRRAIDDELAVRIVDFRKLPK